MIDFKYLYQGLCGLARAHRAGTMAGHLGAAVVAGYFFGEDQAQLPGEVFQGVENELERVIAGEEAIWFNAKKAGVTPTQLFRELPQGEPAPEQLTSIADALARHIGRTRQSGHNVIFGSIALRALHEHEQYATAPVIDGVRKLMEGFKGAPPGRGYYGEPTGWLGGNQVKLDERTQFPAYASIQQMVDVTIDELIERASVRKQGFGGLWHLINHAAGIVELDRLGYGRLAVDALPAHHQHMRLWRSLPDVENELGAVEKAREDPRVPVYWEGMLKRDQARLTHRIKTLYGFYTLRELIDDDARRADAEDALLYLMA